MLPLGAARHRVEPDETYLRLRTLLRKKQKQLLKGSPGIILLEISELGKLLVDEFTISRALYGDLVVTFRAGEEGFPHGLNRKPNGYFMGTSRVSTVVIAKTQIEADRVLVNREEPAAATNTTAHSARARAVAGVLAEGRPFGWNRSAARRDNFGDSMVSAIPW